MGSLSAHILRMPGISTCKALPGPIYHQRAQSNEFWLRTATRTSFFTIVCCRKHTDKEFNHELINRVDKLRER